MPILARHDLRTNYQLHGPDLCSGQVPMAMIHGLGANLAFWYLGALRHLGQDRPTVLYDMRGHGASSMPQDGYRLEQLADDFRALLDDLALTRVHVVGHSHGARVALAFALAHPDRVASLTLADTQILSLQKPMRLSDWPHWSRWKAELAEQGVEQFPSDDAVMDFRLLADLGPRGGGMSGPAVPPLALAEQRAIYTAANQPHPVNDEEVDREVEDLARVTMSQILVARTNAPENRRISLRSRQMGSRASQKWQALLETTSASVELHDESSLVPANLAGLSMPTLLVYGEKSHCIPTSERLMDVIPGARRILVPDVGHFFPIVKPRLFARALRAFLARVEAPETPERRRFFDRIVAARALRMSGKAV